MPRPAVVQWRPRLTDRTAAAFAKADCAGRDASAAALDGPLALSAGVLGAETAAGPFLIGKQDAVIAGLLGPTTKRAETL